jgi:hypothetical protein
MNIALRILHFDLFGMDLLLHRFALTVATLFSNFHFVRIVLELFEWMGCQSFELCLRLSLCCLYLINLICFYHFFVNLRQCWTLIYREKSFHGFLQRVAIIWNYRNSHGNHFSKYFRDAMILKYYWKCHCISRHLVAIENLNFDFAHELINLFQASRNQNFLMVYYLIVHLKLLARFRNQRDLLSKLIIFHFLFLYFCICWLVRDFQYFGIIQFPSHLFIDFMNLERVLSFQFAASLHMD